METKCATQKLTYVYCKPLLWESWMKNIMQSKNENVVLLKSAYHPIPVPRPLTRCVPLFDVRDIMVTVQDNKAAISSIYAYLPTVLLNTLCDMALVHSSLCDVCEVKGRVALIRGTPCPKWHVDKVTLRGICSLIGPGTVLQENDEELHLDTGDAVFMRGAGPEETWEQAVLHRSPHIDESDVRLVVQTDCWIRKHLMTKHL